MSDSHLPEDTRRWPREPHALLNVERGIDRRELRRAYTRLIRSYKPEQFPEEFRKLREAYEQLLQQIEWRERGRDFDGGETETVETTRKDSRAEREHSETRTPAGLDQRSRSREPTLDDKLDQLWQLACDGQEIAVYAQLKQLTTQHANRQELYIRLYWLLVAAPKLDADRQPASWLLGGLMKCPESDQLGALLCRELLRVPDLALRDGVAKVLGVIGSNWMRTVLALRWQRAVITDRYQVLGTDIEMLRSRLEIRSAATWVRAMLMAIDHLVWIRSPEVQQYIDALCAEIERQEFVHAELSDELDRLDYVRQFAKEWQKLAAKPGVHPGFVQWIPLAWIGASTLADPLLLKIAQEFTSDPAAALRALDKVLPHRSALMHLGVGLRDLYRYDSEPETSESAMQRSRIALAELVARFGAVRYSACRLPLLKFCLDHLLSPVDAAVIMAELACLAPDVRIGLAQELSEDLPAHVIYAAHESFWS